MNQRALRRVLVGAVLVALSMMALTPRSEVGQQDLTTASVPDGHRVVSVPIDDNIPPLSVGDEVDFYVAPTLGGGLESEVAGVEALTEPGVVVSIEGEALAVAVSEDVIARLVTSLAEDAVLIVRR